MTSVAHFHQILKKDFFNRIAFLRNYLSNADILNAIESENYRWRKRIWTPMRTLLCQVHLLIQKKSDYILDIITCQIYLFRMFYENYIVICYLSKKAEDTYGV